MNVHITYKVQKTPDLEKEFNQQIEKLKSRLQVFRPELVHLKAGVTENPAREGVAISVNLRLPSGQLAANETGPNGTAVVKAVFEEVGRQLNKHKELLRASHKWIRRRSFETQAGEPGVPFEETVAAVHVPTVSADDVRGYVNANLNRLQRYVERELYFRQTSDSLPPDSVTVEEVIDEVIARALGDGDKPERVSLEPWLYRLANRALNDLVQGSREFADPIHLEDTPATVNVNGSDEPRLQFHQPDETLMLEGLIADSRTATPEQEAYSDEMIALVQRAMKGVSAQDREAFLLYGIEGFSIAEIATILDHTPEEVRSAIHSAREHLRKAPSVAHEFRDKMLQKTGTA